MNLTEHIETVLKEHDAACAYNTPEGNEFVRTTIRKCATELHELAKTIRGICPMGKTKDWRVCANLRDELVAVGQRYSSILWLGNLRDKIVDPIEHTYGISFSGLSVWPEATDTTDGSTVYIAYDPTRFRHGDSYTLAKNGELFFIKVAEFNARYRRA